MNGKTQVSVQVKTINIPTGVALNILQVRPECPVGARLVMLNFSRIPAALDLTYAFGQQNPSIAFQGSGWDFSSRDPCIDTAMTDGLFLGSTVIVAGDFLQIQLVFSASIGGEPIATL